MKMRQRRVLANRCVHTEFGRRPFFLTPYQRRMLRSVARNWNAIVDWPIQTGKATTLGAYVPKSTRSR